MNNIAEACSQMDFIIGNLDPMCVKKIPYTIINYFKKNKSEFYKVNLDATKPLCEQPLLEETRIYIQIIFKLFYAQDEEREGFLEEAKRLFIEESKEKLFEKNFR